MFFFRNELFNGEIKFISATASESDAKRISAVVSSGVGAACRRASQCCLCSPALAIQLRSGAHASRTDHHRRRRRRRSSRNGSAAASASTIGRRRPPLTVPRAWTAPTAAACPRLRRRRVVVGAASLSRAGRPPASRPGKPMAAAVVPAAAASATKTTKAVHLGRRSARRRRLHLDVGDRTVSEYCDDNRRSSLCVTLSDRQLFMLNSLFENSIRYYNCNIAVVWFRVDRVVSCTATRTANRLNTVAHVNIDCT